MEESPRRVASVHNWIMLPNVREVRKHANNKKARNIGFCDRLLRHEASDVTQKALYPVMFVAQCFGILPVSGKLQPDISRLRFSFVSIQSAFSLLLILAFSVQTTFPFSEAWHRGGHVNFDLALESISFWNQCDKTLRLQQPFLHFSRSLDMVIFHVLVWLKPLMKLRDTGYLIDFLKLNTTGEFVFDIVGTAYFIAFFRLAKDWKNVMAKWHQVDEKMNLFQPVNASRKIAIFTGFFMVVVLLEHALSYPYDHQCNFTWEGHLKYTHGPLFRMTEYALWKGIVSLVINFFKTMSWNFTDLFLSAISIALGSKFTQFNNEIENSCKRRENRLAYWKMMRETYNHLALHTKFLDKTLSGFVLLSFFNNLFFMCFQLLNNIKLRKKQLYYAISFGTVLFRFCCVSLTAAAIYERSKKPTRLLFSVPHDRYNVEVHRLLLQVLLDKLTLSGYNFFSITKGLLLTVAGTILTYEIFLIQVDLLKQDNFYEDDSVDC